LLGLLASAARHSTPLKNWPRKSRSVITQSDVIPPHFISLRRTIKSKCHRFYALPTTDATVINPLVYCQEGTSPNLRRKKQFPIIPCNLCGSPIRYPKTARVKTVFLKLSLKKFRCSLVNYDRFDKCNKARIFFWITGFTILKISRRLEIPRSGHGEASKRIRRRF